MATQYLTTDELQAINQIVIEESGGSIGLREPDLLESIAYKPRTSFGGEELYPDIFTKAATLYEAIVNYHVFIDGNKRTGVAAMARFLSLNGYALSADDKAIENYTVYIATDNPDIAQVAAWLERHSHKDSSEQARQV